MANSNQIITSSGSGIDFIRDVAYVLGSSSGDCGTLCTAPNINKWAKFKPVFINSPGQDLHATKTVVNPFTGTSMTVLAAIGTPENKVVTINGEQVSMFTFYGIGMPLIRTGDDFAIRKRWIDYFASHPEVNWPYYKVNASTQFTRITDFDGYDHKATAPIQYQVTDCYTQHAGRVTAIWTDEDFSDKIINMQELANFLSMNMTVKVDIVNKSTGNLYDTLEIGALNQSIDTTTLYGPYSVSQDTTLQAYFYAIGKSGNNNWCLLFPSLPDFPNPMEMTAHKGTGDIQEGILASMDVLSPGCGFAYTHSSTFFESFLNVGEGLYSRLLTNGSYCIRAKVTNPSTSAVSLNKTDISLVWGESGRTLAYTLYYNGSSVNSVSIPAKSTVTINLEISNIFDGMSPVDGTDYGDIDYMLIYYRGQTISTNINTAVRKVANSDSHLGWFLSQTIGYYKSR